MKHVVLLIVLLLMCSNGFAADKDKGKQPPKNPVAEAPKQGSGQESDKQKKAPEWPRPYKPSEEISVDSTVPFPTDI